MSALIVMITQFGIPFLVIGSVLLIGFVLKFGAYDHLFARVFWLSSRQQQAKQLLSETLGPPIFFIQTSSETELGAFATCAVVSAVRHNPTRPTLLLSNSVMRMAPNLKWKVYTVPSVDAALQLFESLGRSERNESVVIARHNILQLFDGTPLHRWYSSGKYKGGYEMVNIADGLRLAVLFRYGGTYYDTDMISIKAIPDSFLLGSAAYQAVGQLNNAAMSFPPNATFLQDSMEEFVRKFKNNDWGFQGPKLLTRVYQKHEALLSQNQASEEPYLQALPIDTYYPISWQGNTLIHMVCDAVNLVNETVFQNTVAIHLYRRMFELRDIKA